MSLLEDVVLNVKLFCPNITFLYLELTIQYQDPDPIQELAIDCTKELFMKVYETLDEYDEDLVLSKVDKSLMNEKNIEEPSEKIKGLEVSDDLKDEWKVESGVMNVTFVSKAARRKSILRFPRHRVKIVKITEYSPQFLANQCGELEPIIESKTSIQVKVFPDIEIAPEQPKHKLQIENDVGNVNIDKIKRGKTLLPKLNNDTMDTEDLQVNKRRNSNKPPYIKKVYGLNHTATVKQRSVKRSNLGRIGTTPNKVDEIIIRPHSKNCATQKIFTKLRRPSQESNGILYAANYIKLKEKLKTSEGYRKPKMSPYELPVLPYKNRRRKCTTIIKPNIEYTVDSEYTTNPQSSAYSAKRKYKKDSSESKMTVVYNKNSKNIAVRGWEESKLFKEIVIEQRDISKGDIKEYEILSEFEVIEVLATGSIHNNELHSKAEKTLELLCDELNVDYKNIDSNNKEVININKEIGEYQTNTKGMSRTI